MLDSINKSNHLNPKIGVIIPARNEADNITQTLTGILNQTLKPKQVVVVNDRSTDDTKIIVESMGVAVIDFKHDHENWVMDKNLAYVFNLGLYQMCDDLDYVVIVGADDILPEEYFQYISSMMIQNNITIASGRIGDEHNTIPRGSGRLVDWNWWRSIGGKYPVNYGYESWLLAKCKVTGHQYCTYPEIKSTLQRPIGANYTSKKYIHRGKAFRALGYNRRFVLIKALMMILKRKQFRECYIMIKGFLKGPEEYYEHSIRKYFNEKQNKQMSLLNIRQLKEVLRNV